MQASPFRQWLTLKRANMRAKVRTNVRVRAGARPATPVAKERTPAKARVVAQPTELNRLKFSNQALAARLSKQLGPLCGVGVFMLRPHPHNLGHLDQGKVELAFVFWFERGDPTNANFIDHVHSRL
jgi:hypothetical protein